MNLSKKQFLAIIAILMLLTTVSITFAVLYFTRNVSITGGIAKAGRIHLYEEDGVTEWTSFDFPLFNPGETRKDFDFFVNNTGNTPVYVNWNMSYSNITWITEQYYPGEYDYLSSPKYRLIIWNVSGSSDFWSPNDCPMPESLYLEAGDGAQMQLSLILLVNVYATPPETIEATLSFYAEDV